MVAGPAQYENFPGWYSWVKWVLPIGLALLSGGMMAGALTGWIGTFGYLDGAISLVAGLQGFSAMAMVGVISGFVASAVCALTLAAVRIGLSFVTEDIATHNLNRAAQLQEQLETAQNQLEEERANLNEIIANLDTEKENVLAQYHQLLGRTDTAERRNNAPARRQAPRQNEEVHHAPRKRTRPIRLAEEAANEPVQQEASVVGKRKARRT
jgi:TolA-binding protein